MKDMINFEENEPEVVNDNQLVVKINESGVNEETALSLKKTFLPLFLQAEEWSSKAKSITVTDATQLKEMKLAKESRLFLKNIRCEVERKRKEKKLNINKEGKAIDGLSNFIKDLIEPTEKYLFKQENFIKEQEDKRKQALKEKRIIEIGQYVEDVSFYQLDEMTEDAYSQLLESSKTAHENKKAAEEKAEADRIAKEKADREEQERIKAENESLRAEQAKKDAELKKANDKIKAQKLATAKAAADKLKKEKQEKEAAEEALREKEAAPDRKKMEDYISRLLNVEPPELKSDKCKKILFDASLSLSLIADTVQAELKK